MNEVTLHKSPLEELILNVLDEHDIQFWGVEALATWVQCKCGQMDSGEDTHALHLAVQLADAVEQHKRLVVPLPDPADHATTSRDYGRGFSDAIQRVKELLDEENAFAWTHGHARDPGAEPKGS